MLEIAARYGYSPPNLILVARSETTIAVILDINERGEQQAS